MVSLNFENYNFYQKSINSNIEWRRGWDSNPRNPLRLNNFRDCPIQPLSHLSANVPFYWFEWVFFKLRGEKGTR